MCGGQGNCTLSHVGQKRGLKSPISRVKCIDSIQALNNGYGHLEVGKLLLDAFSLFLFFFSIQLNFVFFEANEVVHDLTKFA